MMDISNMLFLFTYGFLILIISIIFHELGHFIYLLFKGYKPTISFLYNDKKKHYELFTSFKGYEMPYNNIKRMYLAGIIMGLFPLLVAFVYNSVFLILFLVYIVGCSKDIKALFGYNHGK
jgi:hypothetical protein